MLSIYPSLLKRSLLMLLFSSLIICILLVPAAGAEDIKVSFGGKSIEYKYGAPVVIKERSLLPLRDLLVNLGVTDDANHIQWDPRTRTIKVIDGEITLEIIVGSTQLLKNGLPFRELDVPATIVNGRLYLPLRAVAEALEYDIKYDKGQITINPKKIESVTDMNQSVPIIENVTQPPIVSDIIPIVVPENLPVTPPVTPPATPPVSGGNSSSIQGQVTGVKSLSNTSIEVEFNKELNRESAERLSNYSAKLKYGSQSSLTITLAQLQNDKTKVILTTVPQVGATLYSLMVSNVMDQTNTAISTNVIAFAGIAPPPIIPTPSMITSAISTSNTSISIQFSQAMDVESAQSVSNYTVSAGLTITNASLSNNGLNLILTTTPQQSGSIYTLNINIKDSLGATVINSKAFIGTGTESESESETETETGPSPVITTEPNKIYYAYASNNVTVVMQFLHQVDATSAQTVSNYSIDNGLAVLNASLSNDGRTLLLTTTLQNAGAIYNLTVRVNSISGESVNDSMLFASTAATP